MPLGGESTGRLEDPHAAPARAEGRRSRLGAVRLADGAHERRSVLDVRSCERRNAVAARRRSAGALAAVLRGLRRACSSARGRARRVIGRRRGRRRRSGASSSARWARCAELFRATLHCAPLRARSSNAETIRPATSAALGALLDLYCGPEQPLPEFLRAVRAAIHTAAVRSGAPGCGRSSGVGGKVVLVGLSEPRQPRAAGRLHLGLLAEHREST